MKITQYSAAAQNLLAISEGSISDPNIFLKIHGQLDMVELYLRYFIVWEYLLE